MRQENLKTLENLSLFCHIAGIITIFLSITVIFMDLLNRDFKHIQVGLYILVTGYTFVKISAKIIQVTEEEKLDSKGFQAFGKR